jgi:hypothetical protein
VQGTLLASAISPDNTPHGYNLTFAFPMLMFIIIATLLYLRFRSPHRVPGQAALASAREDIAGPAHNGTTDGSTLVGAAGGTAEPDTGYEGTGSVGTGSEGTVQESEGE